VKTHVRQTRGGNVGVSRFEQASVFILRVKIFLQ
jgi:hypothetical protein